MPRLKTSPAAAAGILVPAELHTMPPAARSLSSSFNEEEGAAAEAMPGLSADGQRVLQGSLEARGLSPSETTAQVTFEQLTELVTCCFKF